MTGACGMQAVGEEKCMQRFFWGEAEGNVGIDGRIISK